MNGAQLPILHRLREWWKYISPRLTYVGLWASLAMLMTIIPFTKGETGAVALTTLFSVMLIAAVMTIRGNRRLKLIALFFLILSISARWLSLLTGEMVLETASYIFSSATLAWVTLLLIRSLFQTKIVTSTTVWVAISGYILIGLTWASVFTVLESMAPGSFKDTVLPDTVMNFPVMIYYSFVTLATLGYGDIVPMTQEARGLVIMEVLTGVLYMAILISRLVDTWKPRERVSK